MMIHKYSMEKLQNWILKNYNVVKNLFARIRLWRIFEEW